MKPLSATGKLLYRANTCPVCRGEGFIECGVTICPLCDGVGRLIADNDYRDVRRARLIFFVVVVITLIGCVLVSIL